MFSFRSFFINNSFPLKKEKNYNIPQKLHFIWLGDLLPENYVTNIRSFIFNNPQWKVRVKKTSCGWTRPSSAPVELLQQQKWKNERNYWHKVRIILEKVKKFNEQNNEKNWKKILKRKLKAICRRKLKLKEIFQENIHLFEKL